MFSLRINVGDTNCIEIGIMSTIDNRPSLIQKTRQLLLTYELEFVVILAVLENSVLPIG